MRYEGKVGFAVGTGRCGTLFLHQLIDKEPAVASSHERNANNETFHRYCKWHELPVDDEGFLAVKHREILADLERRDYSFEASAFLSLSVNELHERFGARFVLLVRRPDKVVTSFVHKGFYREPYIVGNAALAAGYQQHDPSKFHNFFARISPRGEFLRTWNEMSQVGRVAWFWRAWNERTIDCLGQLPPECYRIVRIEDLDYQNYRELSRFLGYEARVGEADFEALRRSKPHAYLQKRNIEQWSENEVAEFEGQVAGLAAQFGYEHRVANLVEGAKAERVRAEELGRLAAAEQQRQLRRLRRATASVLRGLGNRLQGLAKGIDVR